MSILTFDNAGLSIVTDSLEVGLTRFAIRADPTDSNLVRHDENRLIAFHTVTKIKEDKHILFTQIFFIFSLMFVSNDEATYYS